MARIAWPVSLLLAASAGWFAAGFWRSPGTDGLVPSHEPWSKDAPAEAPPAARREAPHDAAPQEEPGSAPVLAGNPAPPAPAPEPASETHAMVVDAHAVNVAALFRGGVHAPPGASALLAILAGREDVRDHLLEIALDESREAAVRLAALQAFLAADPEAGLELYERLAASVSGADRALARSALVGATTPAFRPHLVAAIQEAGPEEDVSGLVTGLAALRGPHWGTAQAVGEPDTFREGDHQTAWASQGADMGPVWMEVGFERAVRPDALRIHETYNPGAVSRVEARVGEQWVTLWEGLAPLGPGPRWFEPPLAALRTPVRAVRIWLETDRVPGWNEIDAVELIGDGLRQWATSASASSTYGQP
jgi:hypothetical protein